MDFIKRHLKAIIAVSCVIVMCVTGGVLLWILAPKHTRADIVVTIFPGYDWVKQVLGDNPAGYKTRYLLSGGIDPHNYEPSTKDMADIKNSKMFIYVGDHETWLARALKDPTHADRRVISMMGASAYLIDLDDDPNHDHSDDCDHGDYDEHIWLSLLNARTIVTEIARQLGRMDPDNASMYTANATAYNAKLTTLHTQYQQAVTDAPKNMLLFADRFPFRYMAYDYGLDYYAIFPGCAATNDPPVDRIASAINVLKDPSLNLTNVFVLENSTDKWAKSVISNSGRSGITIREMHALQSVKTAQIKKGATYLSIMQANLETLKSALA